MSGPEPLDDVSIVAEELAGQLSDHRAALTPTELRASDPAPLRVPGLYSWWADADGAGQLSDGLRQAVSPGLIYAGLAGATRWPSGRPSTNPLWSRLVGMHLGKRARFSTFRLTLGSVLATHWGDADIDEARLTEWMGEHLRVVPLPWPDPDRLKAIEHQVLQRLDPPLNLDGMERTAIRRRLTELRRGRR